MGEMAAQLVAEGAGVVRGPVGVHADQVERGPVDVLPGRAGVGDPAAEGRADGRRRLGEEGVQPGRPLRRGGPAAHTVRHPRHQGPQPLAVGGARHEPLAEDAHLASGDEHHLRAPLPHRFRPAGAVGEERQHPPGRKVHREGREPHLQTHGRGAAGGGLQALRLPPRDPDGVAAQDLRDHRHVPPDVLGGEHLAGQPPAGQEPGVVVDAPCAQRRRPLTGPHRAPADPHRSAPSSRGRAFWDLSPLRREPGPPYAPLSYGRMP
jgi:hypothetical protein